MERTFRIFIQHHHAGGYTVTLPGLPYLPDPTGEFDDGSAGGAPITSSLAAHGLILEEVKDEVRKALAKWLARCDPSELGVFDNFKPGQKLQKVTAELRPDDRHGRKGRSKVRMEFSLLVTPDRGNEEDGDVSRATQFRISVPRFLHPPLSFFVYQESEIADQAEKEIAHYLKDETLDELQAYEFARRELLDTLSVTFTPLKPSQEKAKKKPGEEEYTSVLRECATELTARAAESRLLPCYNRDAEATEILNILASEDGSASLLLVGPSGSGKTALAHEVVRRIQSENAPVALNKRRIWHTTPSQLISGCSYVGQWEERLRNIIAECAKRRHLLFIGDVFGLLDTGKWSKSDGNMAEFLRPFIADGTVVVLGESSPERLRIAEAREPGFVGLFRRVGVTPTDDDRTLSILSRVAGALERRHGVRIEPGACEAAVELTRRFQPYLSQPGKSVAFLTRAAGDAETANPPAPGQAKEDRRTIVLTRREAVAAFARQTGLPEFLLSDHLPLDIDAVRHHFEERLIGQPDAVATVVDLITVIKAGLNDPDKPLGTFLFVGPTGVGKTEMAKALAEYLFGSRDRLLRYDMSEYGEPLNVGKLIGSAHGDDEGELTKKIRLQPFSVVLLDEFEKAHSSIFDVCLQLFGEGRVTDAGGRTADFRSAILLLTSNLGASSGERRRVGFRSPGAGEADEEDSAREAGKHYVSAVEAFFRPEFVNRLDRVVAFRPLGRDAMRKIASREISLLLQREGIARRNLLVEIDDDLLDVLLLHGFHPVYGARPLKREIERMLIVPLARHLIERRITGDHLVTLRKAEGAESVAVISSPLSAPRQAVVLSEGEKRKLTLPEIVAGLAAVRRGLQTWDDDPRIASVREELRSLMARTRSPKFDTRDYKTWQRIYLLERITKRLTQLIERSEYLEEFAAMARRERRTADRYTAELAQSLGDLTNDSDFWEMEVLFVDQGDSGQALLRIAPIGRTARFEQQRAWVLTLARMYLTWAKRKGYDFGVLVPSDAYARRLQAENKSVVELIPGWRDASENEGLEINPPYAMLPHGDPDTVLARVQEIQAQQVMLFLRGVHVAGFLEGEAGGHKLLTRGDDNAASGGPFYAAHVALFVPANEELKDDRRGAAGWLTRQRDEARLENPKVDPFAVPDQPEIIRLYQPGGQRFARDLKTGLETTLVQQVLAGELLDRFLLAYLKRERTA